MAPLPPGQLAAALAYFVTGLVWAILAWDSRSGVRRRMQRSLLVRLAFVVAAALSTTYLLEAGFALLPGSLRAAPPPALDLAYFYRNLAGIVAVSAFRHMTRYLPLRVERPGAGWLARNYGSAAVVVTVCFVLGALAPRIGPQAIRIYQLVYVGYLIVMLALSLRQLRRIARPGWWRPGGLAEARWPDFLILAGGLAALTLLGIALIFFGPLTRSAPAAWEVALDVGVGLGLAVPFAARALGEFVRLFVLTSFMIAVTAAAYFGGQALRASLDSPWQRALVDAAAIALVVVLIGHAHLGIRSLLDQFLFRRSRRRREELQAFVQTLSPERGARECCRLALAEITRVMQLRGAAILLDDGTVVEHGAIDIAPLREVWPRGAAAAALPSHPYGGGGAFSELPPALATALRDADVTGVVPVVSPRGRRGDLFITTGPLGSTFSAADVEAIESFASQVALALDGAELLGRAVAVERSLAHAEKLAAIGETAARIAHDIRNPVTAARSLAQQLARGPASSPDAEAAQLILEDPGAGATFDVELPLVTA